MIHSTGVLKVLGSIWQPAIAVLALVISLLSYRAATTSDDPRAVVVYDSGSGCYLPPVSNPASEGAYFAGGFATSVILTNPGAQSTALLIRSATLTLSGPSGHKDLLAVGDLEELSQFAISEGINRFQAQLVNPTARPVPTREPREGLTSGSLHVAAHGTEVWTPLFLVLMQSNEQFGILSKATLRVKYDDVNAGGFYAREWVTELDPAKMSELMSGKFWGCLETR